MSGKVQNAAKLGRVVASPPFFNLRGVGVDVLYFAYD